MVEAYSLGPYFTAHKYRKYDSHRKLVKQSLMSKKMKLLLSELMVRTNNIIRPDGLSKRTQ
jgi:hypothetical protein